MDQGKVGLWDNAKGNLKFETVSLSENSFPGILLQSQFYWLWAWGNGRATQSWNLPESQQGTDGTHTGITYIGLVKGLFKNDGSDPVLIPGVALNRVYQLLLLQFWEPLRHRVQVFCWRDHMERPSGGAKW